VLASGADVSSLANDTGLVAFGVCHHNPRLLTLANVDALRAMSLKTSHLGVLVIRPEAQMQPALSLLSLGNLQERRSEQRRPARYRWPDDCVPYRTGRRSFVLRG